MSWFATQKPKGSYFGVKKGPGYFSSEKKKNYFAGEKKKSWFASGGSDQGKKVSFSQYKTQDALKDRIKVGKTGFLKKISKKYEREHLPSARITSRDGKVHTAEDIRDDVAGFAGQAKKSSSRGLSGQALKRKLMKSGEKGGMALRYNDAENVTRAETYMWAKPKETGLTEEQMERNIAHLKAMDEMNEKKNKNKTALQTNNSYNPQIGSATAQQQKGGSAGVGYKDEKAEKNKDNTGNKAQKSDSQNTKKSNAPMQFAKSAGFSRAMEKPQAIENIDGEFAYHFNNANISREDKINDLVRQKQDKQDQAESDLSDIDNDDIKNYPADDENLEEPSSDSSSNFAADDHNDYKNIIPE